MPMCIRRYRQAAKFAVRSRRPTTRISWQPRRRVIDERQSTVGGHHVSGAADCATSCEDPAALLLAAAGLFRAFPAAGLSRGFTRALPRSLLRAAFPRAAL